MLKIGITAPCSAVPAVELAAGIKHLQSAGFQVKLHPQVHERHFTFAGPDDSRAQAFFDFASDPDIDVLWSARGGYGASRLTPILDRLTAQHGKPPHKLLVGYSDVTVLHEYVRKSWGWDTLHARMPAEATFSRTKPTEWNNTIKLIQRHFVPHPATDSPLAPLHNPGTQPVRAPLVGGNLALWSALVGTKHPPTPAAGHFLFLEDIDEAFYRLDRMITQVRNAGLLDNCRAILLGDFTNCKDDPSTCLAPCEGDALTKALDDPYNAPRIPLRKTHTYEEGIHHVFTQTARDLNIPLYQNLKVGHGPHFHPLPLGATYHLTPVHRLQLLSWNWTRR